MKVLTLLAPDDLQMVTLPGAVSIGPKLNLGPVGPPLTITTNAVTISTSYHKLLASGTTAQRSLRTINGGVEGDVLVLRKDSTSVGDPIIDDNAGNIQSAGNFTLTSERDMIMFLYDGSFWCEMARSNNA